jgi:hypothetical protein
LIYEANRSEVSQLVLRDGNSAAYCPGARRAARLQSARQTLLLRADFVLLVRTKRFVPKGRAGAYHMPNSAGLGWFVRAGASVAVRNGARGNTTSAAWSDPLGPGSDAAEVTT